MGIQGEVEEGKQPSGCKINKFCLKIFLNRIAALKFLSLSTENFRHIYRKTCHGVWIPVSIEEEVVSYV